MNISEKLILKMDFLASQVEPTITNPREFERNFKNDCMVSHLIKRHNMIEKQFSFIGKEVYNFKKSFSVTTLEEYETLNNSEQLLNPLVGDSYNFKEKHFHDFVHKYIKYQIEYLTKELITKNPCLDSTDKFTNLTHFWKVECKQELIEFYNELLVIKI